MSQQNSCFLKNFHWISIFIFLRSESPANDFISEWQRFAFSHSSPCPSKWLSCFCWRWRKKLFTCDKKNLTDGKWESFFVCFLIKSMKPKMCQFHFPFWNTLDSCRAECYSFIILSISLQIMLFGINDHLRHANINTICFHNNWHAAT